MKGGRKRGERFSWCEFIYLKKKKGKKRNIDISSLLVAILARFTGVGLPLLSSGSFAR